MIRFMFDSAPECHDFLRAPQKGSPDRMCSGLDCDQHTQVCDDAVLVGRAMIQSRLASPTWKAMVVFADAVRHRQLRKPKSTGAQTLPVDASESDTRVSTAQEPYLFDDHLASCVVPTRKFTWLSDARPSADFKTPSANQDAYDDLPRQVFIRPQDATNQTVS